MKCSYIGVDINDQHTSNMNWFCPYNIESMGNILFNEERLTRCLKSTLRGVPPKKVFLFKIDLATNFDKCDLATRIKETVFSIIFIF